MKKKAMLALATVFMMSLSVMAQDPNQNPTPEKSMDKGKHEMKRDHKQMITPEKRAEKLAKDLELTADQKAKVQSLFEKQDAKRKEQMVKEESTKKEMRAKFESERKANDEELTKILGPEKFQKLQSMRADQLQKMKDKRGRKDAGEKKPEKSNAEN